MSDVNAELRTKIVGTLLSFQCDYYGLQTDIADAILAMLAKGDTPAPKHALHCGYWLDLNCSCKLEDNTP